MADFSQFIVAGREPICATRHSLVKPKSCVSKSKALCCSDFLFKVIKLLGTEKAKKNKTNLVFLAGNRVLKSIEQSHSIEKALTSLLK